MPAAALEGQTERCLKFANALQAERLPRDNNLASEDGIFTQSQMAFWWHLLNRRKISARNTVYDRRVWSGQQKDASRWCARTHPDPNTSTVGRDSR